jgi:hypothetical protein
MVTMSESQPSPRRTRRAAHLAGLVLALAARALHAQGPVDPLVLRVQDAVGAPGGTTAIVLRTYASRPVRRGKVNATASQPPGAPAAAGADAPTVSPIASWLGGFVFDASGEVSTTFEPQPDGSFSADFQSLDASINRQDGVFLVLFATLDASVVPGDQYTLSMADVLPFEDPEGDPILLEFRTGRLRIRAASDPLAFGVAQLDVQPGSGAVLELDTREPFAIGSGTVVLHYDPNVLLPGAVPSVTGDPRHGVASLAVDVSTPGTITIGLVSSPGAGERFLNEIPGELFRVTIPTRPDAPLNTQSDVTLDPATQLYPPGGGAPIPLALENGGMFFAPVPNVFHDNFEIGDAGWWSQVVGYVVTPP